MMIIQCTNINGEQALGAIFILLLNGCKHVLRDKINNEKRYGDDEIIMSLCMCSVERKWMVANI